MPINMRELKIVLLLMLASHSASSQVILSDSLVLLYPHWKKGESHSYRYLHSTSKQNDNGVHSTSVKACTVDITIKSRNRKGYILSWAYRDYSYNFNGCPAPKEIVDLIQKIPLRTKVDYSGSEFSLLNWRELRDWNVRNAKTVSGMKPNSTNKEHKAILEWTIETMGTRKAVEGLAVPEMDLFHLFNGGFFELMDTLRAEAQIPSVIGDGLIKGSATFVMTELNLKDSTVTLEAYEEMDKDQMREFLMGFFEKFARETKMSLPDNLDGIPVFNRFGNITSVIDSRGWPIKSTQRTTVEAGGSLRVEDTSSSGSVLRIDVMKLPSFPQGSRVKAHPCADLRVQEVLVRRDWTGISGTVGAIGILRLVEIDAHVVAIGYLHINEAPPSVCGVPRSEVFEGEQQRPLRPLLRCLAGMGADHEDRPVHGSGMR
jgi:hypothetical protein